MGIIDDIKFILIKQKGQPKEVTKAVGYLYLSIFIGFIYTISYTVFVLKYLTSAEFALMFPLLFFFNLFLIFLTYMINGGHNWARILLSIWIVITIPYSIIGLVNSTNLFWELFSFAILILQIYAIFLLFQKPSSDWFDSMKKKAKKEEK